MLMGEDEDEDEDEGVHSICCGIYNRLAPFPSDLIGLRSSRRLSVNESCPGD